MKTKLVDFTKSLIERKISAGHARAILQTKSRSIMIKVWKTIMEKNLSVRDAENMGITLDSSYVRFAVRSIEENVRIIDCLTKLLTAY